MAHQTTISMRFMFGPKVMMARSLSDASPDANAMTVAYDSLPADFRQKVDQAAQQLQNAMGKMGPALNGGKGQRTPPPLP
jgi:hypothetical protein